MSNTDEANPEMVLHRAMMTREWHAQLYNPIGVDRGVVSRHPGWRPGAPGLTLGYFLEPHPGFVAFRGGLSGGIRRFAGLVERAIVQEDERWKKKRSGDYDGSTDVLFPVRVDDFILDGWEHERKVDVTKKVIADATGWENDNDKYQAVIARLIRDLKDEPEAT